MRTLNKDQKFDYFSGVTQGWSTTGKIMYSNIIEELQKVCKGDDQVLLEQILMKEYVGSKKLTTVSVAIMEKKKTMKTERMLIFLTHTTLNM